MRKSVILMIFASLTVFTGCDFLRALAGRPTSEDLESMRLEAMRREEAIHQARLDSIKREHQMMQDSLAMLDSINQQGGTILNPSVLGGLFTTKLESRYYIVVGSFRSRNNAEALLKRVADRGFAPALISFRNGLIAVGLCPVNTLKESLAALRVVKQESFCPPDVWILVNE